MKVWWVVEEEQNSWENDKSALNIGEIMAEVFRFSGWIKSNKKKNSTEIHDTLSVVMEHFDRCMPNER